MSSRRRDAFHKHLDDCRQCANHPFELCSVGAELLELAVTEDPAEMLELAKEGRE